MAIDAGGGCGSSGGATSGCASSEASREAAAAQAEASRAEAAKAEAEKAEAEKAAAAASVTNAPAVQAAFGVSGFTSASTPPTGMPSLQSPTPTPTLDALRGISGFDPVQARVDYEASMARAREAVQNRDRVNYTPEVLDQKAREWLDSQPKLEPGRVGPSVSERVNEVYDRVMGKWEDWSDGRISRQIR